MATLKFGNTGSCPAMYESIDYVGIPREISQNGTCQLPSSDFTFSLPSNTTYVGNKVFSSGFQDCTHLVSVDLSSLTGLDYGAFQYAFDGCYNLRNVDLSSLISISNCALLYAFRNCTHLTSVDISSLTRIGGDSLKGTFYGCTSLTSVNLSNLTNVASGGLYYTFYGCTSLTSMDLSNLTSVSGDGGWCGLIGCFQGCTSLTSVYFSSLVTLNAQSAFNDIFENCTSLRQMHFSSLTTLGGYNVLGRAFARCENLNIYFPALTDVLNNDVFDDMLSESSNVTVHFPISLKSQLQNLSSVKNGFGGTNSTVLFDIGACETTFNITPSSGNQIYVNSELISGNVKYYEKLSSISYMIFNSNYGLYISNYNIPNSDTTAITTDLTNTTFNTITLNIGVSGLTVVAKVNNIICNLTETSNGMYSLNIYNGTSNSVTVDYTVYTGASYMDATGTIIFTDSDIVETVTLVPATTAEFVRPDLASNGTMGGNAFAVDGTMRNTDSWYIDECGPFRAVDGDLNTEWRPESYGENTEFIFYNPQVLNVTQLITKSEDNFFTPTRVVISASNDAQNWNSIGTFTNENRDTTFTMNLTNSGYYKYYKLVMRAEFEIVLQNLAITATYKAPATT